jgi:hypothetical protein
MKRSLLAIIALWFVALVMIRHAGAQSQPAATKSTPRFTAVDVFVDPHGSPLAAYQLEFIGESSRVKLVGVEGGEPAAFREPPYYDPATLSHSRVIIAALNPSRAADLPSQRVRVARLHLEITSESNSPPPEFSAKLILAASADEKPIKNAAVSVSESQGVDR